MQTFHSLIDMIDTLHTEQECREYLCFLGSQERYQQCATRKGHKGHTKDRMVYAVSYP